VAALLSILRALRRATQQGLRGFLSFRVNNFFLFVTLLLYGELNSGTKPEAAQPFLLLLGLLLLFPLSCDPLARIPAVRSSLWPIGNWQRAALRILSLLFSPVVWIGAFMLLRTARLSAAYLLLGFVVTVNVATTVSGRSGASRSAGRVLRYVPAIPGRYGGLLRNHLREMGSVLDFYVALLLSVGGLIYRFASPHADRAAFPILGLLVALTLSTYTQALFGLELESGIMRYRLLPLTGWEVLATKDAVSLGVLFILLLPLNVAPGVTFGLVALAVGHHRSVIAPVPQQRWRFVRGRLLPDGLVQCCAGFALGMAEVQKGVSFLAIAAGVYLLSLWFYGRVWERRM
jgi:hypothetical protein